MYLDLSAPTNVKATAVASHSVEVTWDRSIGATDYAISYVATNSDDRKRVITKNDSSMSHTITDLNDDTHYTITVKGYSEGNESNESEQTATKTPKVGKYVHNYQFKYIRSYIHTRPEPITLA